jgi:hypothetical protein
LGGIEGDDYDLVFGAKDKDVDEEAFNETS